MAQVITSHNSQTAAGIGCLTTHPSIGYFTYTENFLMSQCLIEILTTRNNYEIKRIKEIYRMRYGKELEDAIKDDTSGPFRRFLVILVQVSRHVFASAFRDTHSIRGLFQGRRSRCCKVDHCIAVADAKALYQAGEKFLGTDEETFCNIFGNRSFPQLRAAFAEYNKVYRHKILTYQPIFSQKYV